MEALEDAWLHLGEPLETLRTWGDVPGHCQLAEVPVPQLLDGGMVVRLLCAGGFGGDEPAQLAQGAVWEVVSVQEKTRYVPGQRIWLNPRPSCGICPACMAGCSASCLDAARPTSFPGWMSMERVLQPWAVRRGVLPVPATVPPAFFSWMVPLARALRIRRTVARRDRVLVVGAGIQALAVGVALEGPGSRVLLDPTGGLASLKPQGFHRVDARLDVLLDVLPEAPDLVVVAGNSPLALQAVAAAGWGGVVVTLGGVSAIAPSQLEAKELTWWSQHSVTLDDLHAAVTRIVEISGFLERLPREVIGVEEFSARKSLDSLWTVVEACVPSY
ncbi:MAG TPA: hypothetical protein PKY05_18560 [Fibrobacteria bacterium]|nr:hypothetical protein [Fibrobacteria bacterium]